MSANAQQIILVADDDPSVGALLKITLERAGYRVVPAFDGEDALAKAKSIRPDLIVLDVMMPDDSSGYAVNQAVKFSQGFECFRHVPILMVSSIPVLVTLSLSSARAISSRSENR